MAQGRKTGGRQPGTPNKATSSLHEAVEAEVGGPLPLLLARIGKNAMDAGDLALAVNAFSKAATYIYPRLQAITIDEDPAKNIPWLVSENGVVKLPPDWPGLVWEINRTVLTGPDDIT